MLGVVMANILNKICEVTNRKLNLYTVLVEKLHVVVI